MELVDKITGMCVGIRYQASDWRLEGSGRRGLVKEQIQV